jgi:aryl-alcohol dehydrogenase-like predicted oxidoreductase
VTVAEIERAAAIHPVATVQSELSLWTRDALDEVVPYCAQHGIAFLPFSPLGRGFLAGRFASSDELSQSDFRRGLPRFQQEALRENLAIVERIRTVAERVAATPAQDSAARGGGPPDPPNGRDQRIVESGLLLYALTS